MFRILAVCALAASLILPTAARAQEADAPLSDMSAEDRERLRTEVRAYLLEHPEVILEAINILEERRNAEARATDGDLVAEHRDRLLNDDHSAVFGNPDGAVTIVEFSDYRCGFCKRAHPIVSDLLEGDDDIRLILKEFPILGPDSVAAGRMAIAAQAIDPELFPELNDALMRHRGELTEAAAYKIAKEVGYDVAALKERAAGDAVGEALAENYEVARALGLQGTPSFVIGDEIVRGFIPLEEMQAAVERNRAAN